MIPSNNSKNISINEETEQVEKNIIEKENISKLEIISNSKC